MKPLRPYAVAMACSLASAPLMATAAWAQQAQGQSANGAVALREVDIRAFIEDVSNATGRTFIIDPRVSGRVTILAQQTLSERELFEVFLSTLRVNGYVAVPTASGAYRIIPDEVAAREPAATSAGPSENRYVTHVFSLRFADAESVANAVRPMLSARGQVTVNRRGNSIVVVDYGSTITRLTDVVTRLDRDNSAFRSIRLRNTSAAEMARVAQQLATAVGEDQSRTMVQAVPVASSNTLVLRGDARMLDQLSPLIQELDVGADYQAGVQVIPLKYAVAEELVPILQQISTAMNAQQSADGQPPANRRANIAAHRATNALIISADPETQEALGTVVRSLDVRRQQILVEAIIVEVSDSAARELGVQFLLTGDGTNAVPFLSTSYSNTAPNLLAVTGALAVDGDSDNPALRDLQSAAVRSLLGASGAIAGVGGQDSNGNLLGLILNALQEDIGSNILSTPSVMTLDNEAASILVGQQIPITTGEVLGDNNSNPFRTVQREDVGVQLEVRPQISEGGAIRMSIRQEVSSIFGPVTTESSDLITNRREIETVVQVDAGQIIVLGGLIQEDVQRTSSGIPGLRSIPVAGRLFRSDGQTRTRTNLMVFLRPTIVTTAEQAAEVTQQQYRQIRTLDDVDSAIGTRLQREVEQPAPAPLPPPPPASRSDGGADRETQSELWSPAPRVAPAGAEVPVGRAPSAARVER
ncbi:MAG: type II secretion system protein GspD [Alphaproteobacteria bacterium]|nr:type II secretion system protein GspD [Alphaproteobacteria bacterium]